MMRSNHGERQTQPTTPVDEQSVHTNQRVERWFDRRRKLTSREEWQEGKER